jgi:hypothetical protein
VRAPTAISRARDLGELRARHLPGTRRAGRADGDEGTCASASRDGDVGGRPGAESYAVLTSSISTGCSRPSMTPRFSGYASIRTRIEGFWTQRAAQQASRVVTQMTPQNAEAERCSVGRSMQELKLDASERSRLFHSRPELTNARANFHHSRQATARLAGFIPGTSVEAASLWPGSTNRFVQIDGVPYPCERRSDVSSSTDALSVDAPSVRQAKATAGPAIEDRAREVLTRCRAARVRVLDKR